MEFNSLQTSYEDLHLESLPEEVADQFNVYITGIPVIRYMTAVQRKRACDLPRDSEGRIIVDVCHPHILENTDYFRPAALYYKENGCYTKLKKSGNPNSEFGKFVKEEIRRIWEGYVRPSDGEWITGEMYFYLNYSPIVLARIRPGTKIADRVVDFPDFWDGVYLRSHYQWQARNGGLYSAEGGHHSCELAARGRSKSYWAASQLARLFTIGDNSAVQRDVKGLITAYQKEYLTKDGTLNKFETMVDFLAEHTEFPRNRLQSSLDKMSWTMGYMDLNTGTKKGTLNSVYGVTSKDNVSKLRGKRSVKIIIEEAGSFGKLKELYQTILPSVQEGDFSFGQISMFGTAGDKDSDFSAMKEFMYNPVGYNMYAIPNVYDINPTKYFVYFYGAYMNRKSFIDKEGNSNVTGALVSILMERYRTKYNSTDPNAIIKCIAENPVTPREAIIRSAFNRFPVQAVTDRLTELDKNVSELSSIFIGKLSQDSSGEVSFVPTSDLPIRDFPLKDNKAKGAIEIFEMPQTDPATKKVYQNRYVAGIDNFRNDGADTLSLGSIFVLDLWTDRLVCEYTGRPDYADDFNELCRRILLFYNARANYENNIKGTYSYFAKMNCLYLLTDTLDFLKDKDMVKGTKIGNTTKGTPATNAINEYGLKLIGEWLIKPVITQVEENGETREVTLTNLSFVKSRGLLKELIAWNPEINVDRIRALGQLMLLRQDRVIMTGGTMKTQTSVGKDYLGEDKFFKDNYMSAQDRAKRLKSYNIAMN